METRKEKRGLKRKRNRRITIMILVIVVVIYGILKITEINNNLSKVDENISGNNERETYENSDLDKVEIDLYKNEEENNKDIDDNTNSINKLEESNINNEDNTKNYYLPLEDDINADDAEVVANMLKNWNYKRDDGKKVAYLTFDDGPSQYVTEEILDILHENNVKATFFVLGKMIEVNEDSKNALIRIAEEGHAIGNHTFTHRYDILYPNRVVNVEAFMSEIAKTERALKNVLGEEFETRLVRFPGGKMSWETKNINKELTNKGYVSLDWNTLNGDAEGSNISEDRLIARLKETVTDLDGNRDTIVILMHDSDQKETTVQYLQCAINYLKELGYEFRTLK